MSEISLNDQMLKSLKSLTADKKVSKKMKADLDMQTTDWMTLLVAQLKYQDMYNTVDNDKMTSQLAQYSQVQAIQEVVSMQEELYAMSTTSYAASLIGKDVTAASVQTKTTSKGKEETLVTTEGKVTGVTLFEGKPHIYIGDKKFALSQIMVVGSVEKKEENSAAGGNTNTTEPTNKNESGTTSVNEGKETKPNGESASSQAEDTKENSGNTGA